MNLLEVKVDVVNYELNHLDFVLRLHVLQLRINLLQLELRAKEVRIGDVMDLAGQLSLVLQNGLHALSVVDLVDGRIKRALRLRLHISRRHSLLLLAELAVFLSFTLFPFVSFVGRVVLGEFGFHHLAAFALVQWSLVPERRVDEHLNSLIVEQLVLKSLLQMVTLKR